MNARQISKKMTEAKQILLIKSFGLSLFTLSSILGAAASVQAQTLPKIDLRGISSINRINMRLPAQTTTGVSIETTSDLGLIETTTSLDRQRITLPGSGKDQVIDVYAGTSVKSVTLFDPATYSSSNPNTEVNDQGPADNYPYICSATAPSSASLTSAGTYTDPDVGIAMATGPGEAPKNAYGEDQAAALSHAPNPLDATVLSAGTQFARQPYLNSGAFGNGLPNTAPMQISPFPAGIDYPYCGG